MSSLSPGVQLINAAKAGDFDNARVRLFFFFGFGLHKSSLLQTMDFIPLSGGQVLLDAGVAADTKDANGLTALHWGADIGSEYIGTSCRMCDSQSRVPISLNLIPPLRHPSRFATPQSPFCCNLVPMSTLALSRVGPRFISPVFAATNRS